MAAGRPNSGCICSIRLTTKICPLLVHSCHCCQAGVKLTDKAAMDRQGFNLVDFVDVGVECTLRQLLEHGYFHADP